VFDPLVAAEVAAHITLDSLLAPARLTRLQIQHAEDPALPGVGTLLDRLGEVMAARQTALGRRIAQTTYLAIAAAARDAETPPDVAAILDGYLRDAANGLAGARGATEDALWQRAMGALLSDPRRLAAEVERQARVQPPVPAGMPIGDSGWFDDILQP